ncbi:mRNA-decapping enzyme subunit 2, partial [Bienertia sinuspersici]
MGSELIGEQLIDDDRLSMFPAFDMSTDESKYLRDHIEFLDLLASSRHFADEEGSEASKLRYTTIALDKIGNYELVETGPLGAAATSSTSRILHFNFKVKAKDDPGAAVQTYFCELTKSNEDNITIKNIVLLGSSDSLPAKPETYGCLYCGSRGIHHPKSFFRFRRGGEYRCDFLDSVLPKIQTYIQERRKEKGKEFIPRFLHPGIKLIDGLSDFNEAETCADLALRVFNAKEGTNFQLVRTGLIDGARVSVGFVAHTNFEAKDKNDPNAPVQTFFAEAFTRYPFYFTDFCTCLGPTNSLPVGATLHGCMYCVFPIHHPPGPGFLTGRESY